MRRFWTWSTVAATVASLAIAGLALRASATAPSQTVRHAAAPVGGFMAKGAGSCAASNCHGSPNRHEGEPILRNEHTTWVTADAHSRAYDALLTDRSKSIARNLNKGKPEVKAHEDARCLACHVTPSAPTGGSVSSDLVDTIRRDGVGCESCHGPAQDWLAAHTTVGWDQSDKARTGFVNMRDYSTRAQTCAGCHVGAPADPSKNLPLRDVNHDLIAAGHPRLNWEFSAYAANTPKHWKTPANEANDLDARLWKIGQVASLNAAADLLHDRAERARDKKAPWPELSEYGCFSCHFGLKPKTDPLHMMRDPEVKLGMPAWGSWHVPMVKVLSENVGPGAPPATVGQTLSALRAEMNTLNSDPAVIAQKADALKIALTGWLGSLPGNRLSEREIRSLMEALNAKDAKTGQMKVVTSWDSAAQRYLALAALHASNRNMAVAGEDPKLRAELEAMLKELKFLDGYDSPRKDE